ncbi:alpha/beta hydrolase [Paenibacillus sp. JTLBN-2024]
MSSSWAGWRRAQHPRAPLFLMGHSMGSFLVQKVIMTRSDGYDGFILSGTNGPRGMLRAGKTLASLQRALQGDSHRSLMMNAIVFGGFNKAFAPNRTRFDWLSRDPAEVDRYIEDPYCGAICTTRFFRDFFGLLQEIQQPEGYQGIPKHKPVYLFSGEKDPVGLNGRGSAASKRFTATWVWPTWNAGSIRKDGMKCWNEVNRDEVTADVIDWLDRHTPSSSQTSSGEEA